VQQSDQSRGKGDGSILQPANGSDPQLPSIVTTPKGPVDKGQKLRYMEPTTEAFKDKIKKAIKQDINLKWVVRLYTEPWSCNKVSEEH